MSKRLRVLLSDSEMDEIREIARRERLTVGEWVRRSLREACSGRPVHDPGRKLRAVRKAVEYSFPAADIEQMIAEVQRGYIK